MFFVLFTRLSLAQEKIVVKSEAAENKVYIYYQLKGDPSEEYDVSICLRRTSLPEFKYLPTNLEGDYEKGKYAGDKKVVIWKLTDREVNMFEDGDDYYFEVTANMVRGGSTWYYYVGAAALAGGAAAVLLGGKPKAETSTNTNNQNMPNPPGRP